MLRSLLTPLTARFENFNTSPQKNGSPLPNTPSRNDDEIDPEEFARDVLIDVMRNSVERLKEAEDARAKLETLAEIHRIMLEDTYDCTKEVFREMDGFLVLMGFLSTIFVQPESFVQEPEEQILADILQGSRLVFMIVSEATFNHDTTARYFRDRVGYESLANATIPLITDPHTMDHTMGLLFSLALHNFTLAPLFPALRKLPLPHVDERLKHFEAKHPLTVITHPDALRVVWTLVARVDTHLRYVALRFTERLAAACHRNHVVLGGLEIAGPLFAQYADRPRNKDKERKDEVVLMQKLLKKLLETGSTTDEARAIFARAVRADGALDGDVLEVLRGAMKARWPDHISMEGSAAFTAHEPGVRGMPSSGFTFMVWAYFEKQPPREREAHTLFGARVAAAAGSAVKWIVQLSIRADGKLQLRALGHKDTAVFTKAAVPKARWTHLALVYHPQRNANPTVRMYVDGVLADSVNWAYPKNESGARAATYIIGDDTKGAKMSWSFASAYLISTPLGDDLPRLIHSLGPRYSGTFQAADLVRFLTYDASTALGVYTSTLVFTPGTAALSPLMKAVRDGLGVPETYFLFALSPASFDEPEIEEEDTGPVVPKDTPKRGFVKHGDAYVGAVGTCALDVSVWRLGGAAVPLRLVQMAKTAHELSRSLGILTDSLRHSWQNSEDMERLRGYELMGKALRDKAELINTTSFETLFEFFGLNYRNPEQSTITNMVAYQAIALDFELWSKTKKDIQRIHLDHFVMLLKMSRHKRFNARQRLGKMSIVRKLLFVLHTEYYAPDMVPAVLATLELSAVSNFAPDQAIKPIISFLAANLHDDGAPLPSPRSAVSRIDRSVWRERAERVFSMLLEILADPACYNKFAAALPVTRICLLLLSDNPGPFVTTCVLRLIALCISVSPSFSRKFELVSGWSILKTVVPGAWDPAVHSAAFDLLLGRKASKSVVFHAQPVIVCPHIVPAIFASLHSALKNVARNMDYVDEPANGDAGPNSPEATAEALIEELIELHSHSTSFRQVFRSQQTTQIFVDAYKMFVSTLASAEEIPQVVIRILEKLMHFAMALALDNDVSGQQKREILDNLQQAETIIDAEAHKTEVDPDLVADNRPMRRRIAARLSLQVGERTIQKSFNRLQDWRKTIVESERKRFRKTILDMRETNRQLSSMVDWTAPLFMERGLWARTNHDRKWRLDETEGPYRIRKKLESDDQEALASHVDGPQRMPEIEGPDVDVESVMQMEVPPWAEAYEISATDMDGQLAEDIVDDKHRRVRHELEPGDVIEAVNTVARITGIDSAPGLLIFGRTHLYLLDGLVENDDGEVVDAKDAPKRLFFVPGSSVELDGPQRAQRWPYDQLMNYSDRTFLFRDVAIEVYFKDSRSLLVVFLSKEQRQGVNQRLKDLVAQWSAPASATPSTSFLRTPLLGRANTRVLSGYRPADLATAQRKWQAREISNFTYLSIINQVSGRTPSDATQYPIFPWVLRDYRSKILDFDSPDSYRDFAKPMGAQSAGRRESAAHRFEGLTSIGEDPFHYGTHFSSSMIVCHFLIRMEPFTHMFRTLQGGSWDLPDRLFTDMKRAYDSASTDSRGDVRELIPEFFNCPDFLENSANLDLGVQNTGERIHDVKLPPWAKQDPLLFVVLNRQALESDYVSEHLPDWIDLIWGCKQKDSDALNVFHPLSYEGSIDLDTIEDELEREATVGIIHNFGQTPRKLFDAPHPQRYMHGLSSLPIGNLSGIAEDYRLLEQSPRPVRDLGSLGAVQDLVVDLIGERIIPCEGGRLCVPNYPHEQVEWGGTRLGKNGNGDLRFVVDRRVVQVIEAAACNCAAFADSETLVTGSSDYAVRLWRKGTKHMGPSTPGGGGQTGKQFTLAHTMRAHSAEVICVTACRAWSIAVSGSIDGSAVLWDLNRGVYVRSIWHGVGEEVHLVAVNETTGYVATCSRAKLCLHTINARPITTIDLSGSSSAIYPPITSMAFLEREYLRFGILATGTSDGTITLRTWNTDDTPEDEKARWAFVTLRTLTARPVNEEEMPCITVLKFVGETLYHGEHTGRTFSWNLPE